MSARGVARGRPEESMKHALMLNYEFPPLGGGGGRVSHSLARGFVQRGIAVDVVTSQYGGLPRRETMDGIELYRVPVLGRKERQTATFVSMFSYLLPGFICAARLCAEKRYDFINTHFVLPTGPLGVLLSRLFHVFNILSIHGGDIYDPSKKSSPHRSAFFRPVVRFLLNRSDCIVAQSRNTRENALSFYRPDKEIAVIPLAYEPFSFRQVSRQELNLSENKKYIISVGRLVKRKGLEYLIQAVRLLDDDVEALIIGDGKEKEPLVELAARLNIRERVHFVGQVSEEKKFQYLAGADIYVLSSLHEGFGIVLQEAMQAGLPIVATSHGGQVDLVADGVNGLLVDSRNARAIAGAVGRLLQDDTLRRKMSAENRAGLKAYSIDTIVERYLSLVKNTGTGAFDGGGK
jgi:glycosyltransferase involved in cell wall biosynthesis